MFKKMSGLASMLLGESESQTNMVWLKMGIRRSKPIHSANLPATNKNPAKKLAIEILLAKQGSLN